MPLEDIVWGAPSTKAITKTSAEVLPASGRTAAIFVNDSLNKIYLGMGNAAVDGKGTFLAASGGSYEINQDNMCYLAVNAISDVSTSDLTIMEGGRK